MIAIDRIGWALGSIASQAPICSSRRRGPSAIATVRKGAWLARGRRPRIDDGDGRALPHRLLDRGCERQSGRAAAGDDDVEDGSGFGQCGRLFPAHCRTDESPYPLLGRGAICESGLHLFKGLRRH